MRVKCLQDHRYNQAPRMTPRAAKEIDVDPKYFSGQYLTTFKAGEEYELDDDLAGRLLRDYGPDGKRPDAAIKFMTTNDKDFMRVILANNARLTVGQAIQRGYIVPDDGTFKPQSAVVDPEGVPA